MAGFKPDLECESNSKPVMLHNYHYPAGLSDGQASSTLFRDLRVKKNGFPRKANKFNGRERAYCIVGGHSIVHFSGL